MNSLFVNPGLTQLERMRLGLRGSAKRQLDMLQFHDLSHFVILVENQSAAMPLLPSAADSDPVNRMIFVLGHSRLYENIETL